MANASGSEEEVNSSNLLRTGHLIPLKPGKPLKETQRRDKGDIEKELRQLSLKDHVEMTQGLQKKRELLMRVLFLRDELRKGSGNAESFKF